MWPIVWLRYFSLVFYQILDIASLTLFLITLVGAACARPLQPQLKACPVPPLQDCQYFAVPDDVKGHNQEFPDVCECR